MDGTTTLPRTDEPGAAVPRSHQAARWAPGAVLLVCAVGLTLAQGELSPLDLLRYIAYIGWGLLVPGVLAYRLLRTRPHTLVEDLAMGATIGLSLEIAAWAVFTGLGIERWLILWPLLVVVPVLALRRDVLRAEHRPVPVLWSWAVAAVAVFYTAYQAYGMRTYDPRRGSWYHLDNLYLLGLVGETKHHMPPQSPHVAGEPLHYHWFSLAHEAASSLVSGVDTPVVYFRLSMPFIGVLSVALLAVAGWRITGRPWAGPIAAVLMFCVGETIIGVYTDSSFGTANNSQWWYTSAAYGVPVTIALAVAVADRLRKVDHEPDGEHWTGRTAVPAVGTGAWVLLVVFALTAPGAKSSIVPAVLAGVGLVGLVDLLTRRRIRWSAVAAAAILGAAFLLATIVLYGFQSHGVAVEPLSSFAIATEDYLDRPWTVYLAATVIMLIGYTVYMLSRVAGIAVLLWLRRGRLAAEEQFLAGAFAGGLAVMLLTSHPSASQMFFLRSAWPMAVMLSAAGYLALAEKHAIGARLAAAVAAACGLTALAVSGALWFTGGEHRTRGWRYLLPVFKPALALAVIVVVAAIACWLMKRPGLGAVTVLTMVLLSGSGGYLMETKVRERGIRANGYHEQVSAEEAQAARWLRANSDPDDVVAINEHLYGTFPLAHGFAAFSERRQLVGAWSYVPKALAESKRLKRNPVEVPFWDPATLADNDAAFTAPTPELLARLKGEHGVRWLVAVRTVSPESPLLRDLATLRFERPGIAVYELR